MIFKSQVAGAHWDNWCFFHEGTYYLYYLITESSPGEGFGVATSRDGVHWEDHGWAIRASEKMVEYLGTGAVWKSPDFETSGRFLCNYSEWRVEPETGKKTQNILFAWSTDLIRWNKLGEDLLFAVDARYYDRYGRWDCIYPLPRQEGGYWGTWTASSLPDSPYPGTVGIGCSEDGLHWTALPAPEVTPGVWESGAFWRFGGRLHAMFGLEGGMWAYTAEAVTGPYRRAVKNALLLAPGHTYFSRFFPLPDGTVLVNHQSNSDLGWHIAPLKRAHVDDEGVLRLKYWEGNESLKGAPVPVSPRCTSETGTLMTGPLDFSRGVVAEGTIRLPRSTGAPPVGLHLLPDHRVGHAIRVCRGGRVEMGTVDPLDDGWQPDRRADRELRFGPTARFRLLARRGMAEFYLDGHLMECYTLKGAGGAETVRLGVLGDGVDDLNVWQMSLADAART